MNIKTHLKNAKAFFASKDYTAALTAADSVLEIDPENVTALLFKASAHHNLDQFVNARDTLEHAIQIQKDSAPAWLGLEKVYDKLNDRPNLLKSLTTLLSLFKTLEDTQRITETLDKLIAFHLQDLNIPLAEDAIKLQLPDSNIYHLLSNPPTPIEIWYRIIDIHETYEIKLADELVSKRSGIIGAPNKTLITLNAMTEIAVTYSKRISVYQNLYKHIQLKDDPVHATRYLDLYLTKSQANLDVFTRKSLLDLAYQIIDQNASVPLAYRLVVDSMDVSSVKQYPTSLLHGLISACTTDTPKTSVKNDKIVISSAAYVGDPVNDDYVQSANWILTNFEPEDMSLEPSGLFPAMTLSFCSQEDEIILLGSESALKYIFAYPSLFPISSCKLRIRRAEILLGTQGRALDALSELNAITWTPPSFDQVMIHQCRANTAFQLNEIHYARTQFQSAQTIINSTPDLLLPLHIQPWVDSSIIWLDFLISTIDSMQAQKLMTGVNANDLTLPNLCAIYHYRLGRLYVANLEYEHAFKQFITAAQLSPTSEPHVFTHLGILFMEHKGDPLRASKCWIKALALNPGDGDAGVRLALYLISIGDYEQAAGILVSITHTDSLNFGVWKRLGLIRMYQKQWNEAVIALQFAVRCKGGQNDANVWSALGEGYIQLGRWSCSIKALRKAHDINEKCLATRYLIALAYFKLGQYNESSIYLTPDYPPCLILIAHVYLHRSIHEFRFGRYKEIARLLTIATSLLETHSVAEETGVIAMCLANLRVTWVMVPHLCPDLENQLKTAVSMFQQLKMWGEAGSALFHCWQLVPDSKDKGTLENAESLLKQAIKEMPRKKSLLELPRIWNTLGCIHACRNEWRWAQHFWILAIRSNPTNPTLWMNLSKMYMAFQDYELAREALQQAVSLDADHPDPWILLAKAEDSPTLLFHVANACPWISPMSSQLLASCSHLYVEHPIKVEVYARGWVEWAPNNPDAWNCLGCAYERVGNLKNAEHALKVAVKLHRTNFNLIENLVRILASLEPARAIELMQQVPLPKRKEWGWSGELVHAFAEHQSLGASLPETLKQCMALVDQPNVFVSAKHLLAQLMYKANVFDMIPILISDSAPEMLCAFGMLSGNNAHVTSGFDRVNPCDAQYLTSLHLLLQGNIIGAQCVLERGYLMYPNNLTALVRLTRFLGRYCPTNHAQSKLALHLHQRKQNEGQVSPTTLNLASTGYLAMGQPMLATCLAQKHVQAYPSSSQAWTQLGVSLVSHDKSNSVIPIISAASLALDACNPFAYILSSLGALTLMDPVQAMQKAESATSLLSKAIGVDNLPAVLYRQLARVLLANNETDIALSMLTKGLDSPVGLDLVSQGVHAGVTLDLVNLFMKMKWTTAACTLLTHLATNNEDLHPSIRILYMAASAAYQKLDLNIVKDLQEFTMQVVENDTNGTQYQITERLQCMLTQQTRALLALATFKAGFKSRGAKLMQMDYAQRSDIINAFRMLGGTVQTAT